MTPNWIERDNLGRNLQSFDEQFITRGGGEFEVFEGELVSWQLGGRISGGVSVARFWVQSESTPPAGVLAWPGRQNGTRAVESCVTNHLTGPSSTDCKRP